MRQLLGSVELIIECRDYRVPLSSRNPMFEKNLVGRERMIVYTKRDLGAESLDEKACDCLVNLIFTIVFLIESGVIVANIIKILPRGLGLFRWLI